MLQSEAIGVRSDLTCCLLNFLLMNTQERSEFIFAILLQQGGGRSDVFPPFILAASSEIAWTGIENCIGGVAQSALKIISRYIDM